MRGGKRANAGRRKGVATQRVHLQLDQESLSLLDDVGPNRSEAARAIFKWVRENVQQ